jgi:LPS-assembly lipoprotein
MGWGARGARGAHYRSTSGLLVRLCLVFAIAGLAAGCFQPVYGDRSVAGGPGVHDAMKGVEIPQIVARPNSPEAPISVQLRNELLFSFTGGGSPAAPTHRLTIQLVGTQSTVAIDNAGFTQIENFRLTAIYNLVEIATKRTVMVGQAATAAGYDGAGQQRFARISAAQDAGRRATKEISDQITTRIAAYFVTGS